MEDSTQILTLPLDLSAITITFCDLKKFFTTFGMDKRYQQSTVFANGVTPYAQSRILY